MFQDRDYQSKAQDAIEKEYKNGTAHQLVSMATGTGKTVVFSKLPSRLKHILPGQTLILAHREELIDQAIEKMARINPDLKIDKEKAEYKADPSIADVVVASVATLGRKGTKRLDKYNWQNFDKYITDEAHHSIADSYMNVYEAAGLLNAGDKRLLLGVTATPMRGDGKKLAQLYKKIVYTYSMRQAIEDGWLVDVKGLRINTKVSLDQVKSVGGDFSADSLANFINNPQRNQLVTKAWMDAGQNRQTIIFTANIQHAKDLADMMCQNGILAEALWGDDPERKDKLKRHKDGTTRVLINCGVLTEGYDDWQIGCIVLARPTKSPVLFTQMVGRGTRLQEGTGNLKERLNSCIAPYESVGNSDYYTHIKEDCIIIDVVDASTKNTLITLPTLMGMSAGLDLKGRSLVGSVHLLEDAQKEYSHIDFTSLKDISELKSFIESVNLFEVKFPAEVEANSQFCWHNAPDGGYIMLLNNKESLRITQNLLDKWEVKGIINNQKYSGTRDTIEEIFQAADSLVMNKASDQIRILKRKEAWHDKPVTPDQLKLLAKFYKGKAIPNDLTRGKASALIGSFLAGKA